MVSRGRDDVWVWNSDLIRVFSVGSSFGNLLALSWIDEDRSETMVLGLFRIWKS